MMPERSLAEKIMKIGFGCIRCGACCRSYEEEQNRVMVTPAEIRTIENESGKCRDIFALPFPEFIEGSRGSAFTFEWCLAQRDQACTFLLGDQCSIYAQRPWICRTYPFMLDGENLLVSTCPGLGRPISHEDASALASALIARRIEEEREDERVRSVLASTRIPPGRRVHIDGDGMRVLDE